MACQPANLPDAPRRILVRGVNWLGDAVMTTPALRRLRERFPSSQITLLTQDKLADLYQAHPAVDRVLTCARGDTTWQVVSRLRAETFQLGIALPNSARSAVELWLARIPRRFGYGGGLRRLLLTHAAPPRADAVQMRKRTEAEIRRLIQPGAGAGGRTPGGQDHHIHHYLQLVAVLGCNPQPIAPEIVVTQAEVQAVRDKFILKTDDRPWFGLNAGAEYGPAKRWPRERFLAAAGQLRQRTGCRWVIFGGAGDVELAGGIATQLRHALNRSEPAAGPDEILNLAGQTSLRELCALLKACHVLLTNDTGPMHLAAAVGTPVVVPFGSTSPELTGPGLPGDPRHRLLKAGAPCSPCFLRVCPIDFRCMTGIDAEQVVAAVLDAAAL